MFFRDLPIGHVFEFLSIYSLPYSGLEKGPWRKISTRKYEKHEHAYGPEMICQVGNIRVGVSPLGAYNK